MKGRSFWLLPALLIVLSVAALKAEIRTWTDDTGKHKTQAEYVSYAKGQVTLRRSDGREVTLPLTRLSKEDKVYVRERVRQELDEKAKAEKEAKEDSADETSDEPATVGGGRGKPEDLDEDIVVAEDRSPQPSAKQAEPETADVAPAASRPGPTPVVANNILNSVRGAVYRTETLNNLRQIGTALLLYESQRGQFPLSSSTGQRGQSGLSWRVAILPFLEENNLYRQFRQNEPWDSEHNRKLIPQMPKVFLSPGISSETTDGYTNYLAVAGPDTVIAVASRATRVQDIRDGTSKTIMVVEVDDDRAVIWTKPQDLEWDSDQPTAGLGHIWSDTFFAALADGSCRRISLSVGSETLRGLFTRNGGERVELEE